MSFIYCLIYSIVVSPAGESAVWFPPIAAARAAWTPRTIECWFAETPEKLAKAASVAKSLVAFDECEAVRPAKAAAGFGEVKDARLAIPWTPSGFSCEK